MLEIPRVFFLSSFFLDFCWKFVLNTIKNGSESGFFHCEQTLHHTCNLFLQESKLQTPKNTHILAHIDLVGGVFFYFKNDWLFLFLGIQFYFYLFFKTSRGLFFVLPPKCPVGTRWRGTTMFEASCSRRTRAAALGPASSPSSRWFYCPFISVWFFFVFIGALFRFHLHARP